MDTTTQNPTTIGDFNRKIETNLAVEEARYAYTAFDHYATLTQAAFKKSFVELSALVSTLPVSRHTALVNTKLEEAYMWVGKAIRDEQLGRTNSVGGIVTSSIEQTL